ncbi:MAG: hypothetical protein K6U11_01395 [bacterium]|nr:hypothetical protein [bacterium]
MDILTKTFMNPITEGQKGQFRTQIARFREWMAEFSLEGIQKALSDVCGYDVSKFLGVIFGKEYKKILLPTPEILKPYYGQGEISITEAKAYLVSLYIFKICLNAQNCGLITQDPLFGESLYQLLKAKMGDILPYADWEAINRCQNLASLLNRVAALFLQKNPPYAVYLQREARPVEIIDREDMIGVFINSMSSRWVIQFMFSQGFFGVSLLCSVQFILNARRMTPFFKWGVVTLGGVALVVSVILLINSIIQACRDLGEIDKIKSGYLKYLPQWLSPQALERAKQQIVPQFLAAEYGQGEHNKTRQQAQADEEGSLQLFLFKIRKRIQRENPLVDEEQMLELLRDGLEKMHSWSGFQEFIRQKIQNEVLPLIDRMVGGKRSLAQKINDLRRIIKSMAQPIPERQIRQLMIEGVKKSEDLQQFRTFIVKRLKELNLIRNVSFADRFARIFIFMD